MAHTVLLKRSSTASSAPSAGQLSAGELAINTVDEAIFFKNSGGTVKKLSAMSDLTANLVTISTTQTISGLKTFSEHMTLGGKKEFRLADSDSSNYVALTAATTLANNNVYTLPSAVGSANQVLQIASVAGNDATLQWATVSGGGGSPGGSNTQVQFNDSGSFGGDAGLTYNKTTDTLTVAGDIEINGGDIVSPAAAFNIANAATSISIGTSGNCTSFSFGSSNNSSTVSAFGGNFLMSVSISKVSNTLYIDTPSITDFGISGSSATMGFGPSSATTVLGDWKGLGSGTTISINDASQAITMYASGANSYTLPNSRGSAGQVLTTNGSGTLTWTSRPAEILTLYSMGIV